MFLKFTKFQLACQSGLEMRAVGLCQLMSPEVVQLAIKYASKLGRIQLADRIAESVNLRPPSPPIPRLASNTILISCLEFSTTQTFNAI